MSIEYKPANEADIPQLVSLMNANYKRKKGEAYFQWQYFDSVHPTILYVAELNNKIVGMFGLQKKKLVSGAVCGQAIDMLVDSSYRNKGIFRKMSNLAVSHWNDMDVLLVLPNADGKNACEKALGWKTIAKIDEMSVALASCNDAPSINNNFRTSGKTYEMFHYDENIRKWRYGLNPVYDYEYVKLNDSAHSVIKQFTDPETSVNYGDIVEYRSKNTAELNGLFLGSISKLKAKKVQFICAWALPHTPAFSILKMIGFNENPRERYLCIKILNKNLINLLDSSNWDITQADAEIY